MKKFVLSLLLLGGQGFAEPFTAQIFSPESERSELLFHLKREEKARSATEQVITGVFKDAQGVTAVTEEVHFQKGKLKSYAIHQKQLNESGLLEVTDTEIKFSYTRDSKTKSRTEKLSPNLIIAPTTVEFIKNNFDAILKNGVDVRYGALDRCETVGFTLSKQKETRVNGIDAVIIKMKPSNFLIAALVKPLYLTFDRQGRRLLEMKGRTLPKVQKHGQWKDLDAEIVYHYTTAI